MAKKRIVMAIGHKDMGTNLPEQKEAVKRTAKVIADFIQDGWQVAIVHSNAPQVGMIHTAMNEFGKQHDGYSSAPMSVCSAMSQGYIGYHLQNAIGNELASRGMNKDVATVVTQVLVDEADPAFQHPTKPVGAFYDKETADRIAAEKGYTMVEDAGRGYRQVVPSPKPIDVIEKNTVKALVDNGTVVITVGGGGHAEVDHADLRAVAVGNDDLVALRDQIDDGLCGLGDEGELLVGGVAQRVAAEGDDDSFAHDDYLSFDFLKTLFSQKRLTKAADPPFYI